MEISLIDTNVIIRYLVEDPEKVDMKFRGVFTFFPKVENGKVNAELCELVLFEAFFVLTKLYQVPQNEAAEKLFDMVSFMGIIMPDKPLILSCLEILQSEKIDLVDAYLLALSKKKKLKGIFSFDKDLLRRGLKSIAIE
ncbi:MAG: PIN domain-containing protein [Deltaproteobacteria bacterium]|nr:PIN domain-containing protein [Deltaproteobacteria bacterium]